MSVVAFDGKSVAADKQASFGNIKLTVNKLFHHFDEVLSFVGDSEEGLMMINWYKNKETQEFPKFKEYKTTLLVFSKEGYKYYELTDTPQTTETPFIAFGSGRDFAMGAMAAGADAEHAVGIACNYDINCGLGVTVINF